MPGRTAAEAPLEQGGYGLTWFEELSADLDLACFQKPSASSS